MRTHRQTGRPAPKSDYERSNCNNFNIRYWSWNYRGCWHQTCPPIDTRTGIYVALIAITPRETRGIAISCHYLPVSGFGQFTRLLPSLDVVAISQAPSPESNPNSPLPVNAMVGLDPTIES